MSSYSSNEVRNQSPDALSNRLPTFIAIGVVLFCTLIIIALLNETIAVLIIVAAVAILVTYVFTSPNIEPRSPQYHPSHNFNGNINAQTQLSVRSTLNGNRNACDGGRCDQDETDSAVRINDKSRNKVGADLAACGNDEMGSLRDQPQQPLKRPSSYKDSSPAGPTGSRKRNAEVGTRLAQKMLTMSRLYKGGKPSIYQVVITKQNKMQDKRIAKCEIGTPNIAAPPPGKVLMLVGATGAGKTTMINGLCNYIFGVKWEDPYRFQLIDEGSKSQTESQTTWITAYTFHKMEGSPLHHTLTVIDTPGFGDTKGLERDKEIAAQIKDLFSIQGECMVDQIHGIGFVAQAPLARLTQPQKYVFDSILSIFGKNVEDNIFIMVTFADGKDPPVLMAMQEAGIPYRKGVKFNNSALFSKNIPGCDEFDNLFWNMGTKSFEAFFADFVKVEGKSLLLTKEVLKERERLEATIQGLQPQIRAILLRMDNLEQERVILAKHEAQINENKAFTYTVNETHQQKIDLTPGQFVTNCLQCNITCHFPCQIPKDSEKHLCAAMAIQGDINTTCTVCPQHCSWQKHVNNSYRFELYEKQVEKTSEDLMKRFVHAVGGKSMADSIIASIEIELQEMQEHVFDMISQVHRSLRRLDKIALKPNPLSEVEYIDLLIQSEKQEAKPGYQQRIGYYQKVREKAQLLSVVKDVDNIERMKQRCDKDVWAKCVQSEDQTRQ